MFSAINGGALKLSAVIGSLIKLSQKKKIGLFSGFQKSPMPSNIGVHKVLCISIPASRNSYSIFIETLLKNQMAAAAEIKLFGKW